MEHKRCLTRAQAWLCALLTAIPILSVILFVAFHAVDVPFDDQWDFIPMLDKTFSGDATFHDYWALHNEHRIVIPKLIMVGLAYVTHWNIKCEIATGLVFELGIFFVVASLVRKAARELTMPNLIWLLPVCSLMTFSFAQFENQLWGWQLQLFLSVLAVISAIALLTSARFTWLKFSGAVAATIVATFSFANGMLFWPIGTLLIAWNLRGRGELKARLGVWLGVGTLCLVGYFRDYHSPATHPSASVILHRPQDFISYFLKYMGNLCAHVGDDGFLPESTWGFSFGLCGVSLWLWAAWKCVRLVGFGSSVLAHVMALSAYSLATAAMTALGRAGFSTNQALTSRYSTFAVPFWLSLALMLVIIWQRRRPCPEASANRNAASGPTSKVAIVSLGVIVALTALSSFISIRSAEQLSGRLKSARSYLLELAANPDEPFREGALFPVYSSAKTAAARAKILQARHLSLFRGEAAGPSDSAALRRVSKPKD